MQSEVKCQVKSLLKQLTEGVYEKEQIMAMALLSAVAGESIFLLGPPGTAKSLVARRLKLAFREAHGFEYLMSRFSTPDEIFGPVSIALLKNEDKYERVVDGYLPTATVVFLDEIWKAGPAIQNSLLTAINEKLFQNGSQTIHLPMKALIAASNELPAENEGLEALWDRFLIRMVSNNIQSEATFYGMIRQQNVPHTCVDPTLQISDEQYTAWSSAIAQVTIPDAICEIISCIRKRLATLSKGEDVNAMDYYVSDRRWKKCVHLLQAAAFLNGRLAIDVTDVAILFHCLWNKAEHIPTIIDAVAQSIVAPIDRQLEGIERKIKKAISGRQERKETFFYQLDNYADGRCLIHRIAYQHINDAYECNGTINYDDNKCALVISPMSTNQSSHICDGRNQVKLRRIVGGIAINGVPYAFKEEKQTNAEQPLAKEHNLIVNVLLPMLQTIGFLFSTTDNLFVSKRDKQVAREITGQCEERIEETTLKLINAQELLQP